MLGLKRGSVRLCPHEEEWEREAARTMRCLREILGDVIVDVAHVGSTSIPTIMAKPIVDIAVAVRAFEDVSVHVEALRAAGYHLREDRIASQMLFAAGSYYEGTGEEQTHFIHVVLADGTEWRNYINFRNYLIKRPEVARAYETLKCSLAAAAPVDTGREKYLAGKQDFISFTLRKALVDSYLGQDVHIGIDRPVGYVHRKGEKVLVYPINYGYIPGVLGGDGEELDVYLLGVTEPVEEYDARVIAVVHRADDVEDKLVAAPAGMRFSAREIADAIRFQEKYYRTRVECADGETAEV